MTYSITLQDGRCAVDTMQSVCLKEFGAKGKIAEETTLIGLTFGGYLRSKVVHYFDGTMIITFL